MILMYMWKDISVCKIAINLKQGRCNYSFKYVTLFQTKLRGYMEVRVAFRRLVTNKYIPRFDYTNTFFSFITVCKVPEVTYCCCTCGFEHEYLDYIQDDGKINEEIYERVLQSIISGKCPHVKDATQDCLNEAGIYGIHIALAVGTRKAVSVQDLPAIHARHSTLFNLNPFMMALIKNIDPISSSYIQFLRSMSKQRILYAHKLADKSNKITVKQVEALELCIIKNNERMLEGLLTFKVNETGKGDALKRVFQDSFRNRKLLDHILSKLSWKRDNSCCKECCRLAVIYNQPDILERLLQGLKRPYFFCEDDQRNLYYHCLVLKRYRCLEVFSQYFHCKFDRDDISVSEQIEALIFLFGEFYVDLREYIFAVLKRFPNLPERINQQLGEAKQTLLHRYVQCDFAVQGRFRALKALLDFGADINSSDYYHSTPLENLLKNQSSICLAYRQSVELFLYENPDITINKLALTNSLQLDAYMKTMPKQIIFGLGETVHMDSHEHGIFGHHGNDAVLNFFGPLFIESGFPITPAVQRMLTKLIQTDSLRWTEKDFLRRSLETPRQLTLICRDVLRSHFKGRQIHKFVHLSNIPKKVKDFILLRNLLRCIPNKLK